MGTQYPTQKGKRRKLTKQQEVFCREFVISLNKSDAARKAGYSIKSAGTLGHQLLHNPIIAARIEQLQAARIAKLDVDAQWVLRRLLEELDANVSDIFDADGVLLPASQWPLTWQRGLITSITTTELYGPKDENGKPQVIGNIRNIVLADRVKRLELLGRHVSIGAFKEKIAIGPDAPLQELYNQISGRSIRPAHEMRTIEHEPKKGDA